MDMGLPQELWLPIAGSLLTLLAQALANWWRRPSLLIDRPSGAGFRIDRVGHDRNGNTVPLVWLRVRVRNAGRSTAKNVKVYVARYGELRKSDTEAQRLETDPAPLYWAHSGYQEQLEFRLITSLPPKTHQFVDFLVAEENQSPVLRLNSPTDDDAFLRTALNSRNMKVEFMAVDESGNDAFAILEFDWDGTSTSLRWNL